MWRTSGGANGGPCRTGRRHLAPASRAMSAERGKKLFREWDTSLDMYLYSILVGAKKTFSPALRSLFPRTRKKGKEKGRTSRRQAEEESRRVSPVRRIPANLKPTLFLLLSSSSLFLLISHSDLVPPGFLHLLLPSVLAAQSHRGKRGEGILGPPLPPPSPSATFTGFLPCSFLSPLIDSHAFSEQSRSGTLSLFHSAEEEFGMGLIPTVSRIPGAAFSRGAALSPKTGAQKCIYMAVFHPFLSMALSGSVAYPKYSHQPFGTHRA